MLGTKWTKIAAIDLVGPANDVAHEILIKVSVVSHLSDCLWENK